MAGPIDDLIKSHQGLVAERANFDTLNQEVAEYVLPEHANFTSKDVVQGTQRQRRQYDSTAPTEAERHAAAIDSLATPTGQKWDGLAAMDPRLNERDDVQQYFDDVLDIYRAERAISNFQEQIFDVWHHGGVLGTAPLLSIDKPGGGLSYRCLPTSECYIDVDAQMDVCRLDRRFKLTAKAAYEEYGDKLPQRIKDALIEKPNTKFEFLHVIMKNPARKPGYLDARGMKWVSVEIAFEDKAVLREGGFTSWPAPVYRYSKAPEEWYGRGWAARVLPTIRQVNKMVRSMDRNTEKLADPPLLAYDDGSLGYGDDASGNTPSLGAGDIHWGGMTSDGKPLVAGLYTGADLEKGEKRLKQRQQEIKDAALTSVFQIFQDRERMTATEWLGIMNEKAQLTVPVVGRAVVRFLSQVVERDLDILNRQGKLPPMPRALARAGGLYTVRFNSPLMRLLELAEVNATNTWLGQMVPFLPHRPDLLDLPDFDAIFRGTGKALGVPAKYIRDKDELAAEAAQKQELAALKTGLELAEQGGAVARDTAAAMKDVAIAYDKGGTARGVRAA